MDGIGRLLLSLIPLAMCMLLAVMAQAQEYIDAAEEEWVPSDALEESWIPDPALMEDAVPFTLAPLAARDTATQVVSDIHLACEIAFCEDSDNVEALIRASGLRVGMRVNAQVLRQSIERLRQTGYFSHITQTLETEGNYVEVFFHTTGHKFIRKIIIDSPAGGLNISEIKRRMYLRQGAALYPRTAILRGLEPDAVPHAELIQMALDDQTASLKRLYDKEGYLDAEIDIITEEVDAKYVDVRVKVRQIKGYSLGRIYLRGRTLFEFDAVESAFRSAFSFFSNYTKEQLEDGVGAVLELYRKAGYIQTKVDFVTRLMRDTKTVDVFLDIKEAEKWIIEFDGHDFLHESELQKAVTFYDSGYVDKGELDASLESLRNLYISAGFYWAEIYVDSARPVAQTPGLITFRIKENERTEIGEIVFDGAGALSYGELIDVINSRVYQALGSGAYPQRSMIADDAAKIVDLYRSRGYLNADVSRWILEPIEKGGRQRLTFVIHEGQPSMIAKRQVRFLDRASFERKSIYVPRPRHNFFNDEDLRVEQAQISKQLRSMGYAEVAVNALCNSYGPDGEYASGESCDTAEFPSSCFPDDIAELCEAMETPRGRVEICQRLYDTRGNRPDGEPCRIQDGVSGVEVDIEYAITLGGKYIAGDIFLHGNIHTKDWVLRQGNSLRYGDVFDYNKVIDARSLMRSRTIYNSASVNTIGVESSVKASSLELDSTQDEILVPIVIQVEEGPRRWMDFALGLSFNAGDWILTTEAEYVEANIFGWGWDFRVLLMPELRFVNKSNEFVLARPFNQNWFTLLSLNVPLLPQHGLDLIAQLFYDLRYITETKREEAGGNIELQWKLSNTWFAALSFEAKSSVTASFSLDAGTDIDMYDVCYPVTFFQTCPFRFSQRSQIYSISPRFSYEGRDSPLNPKEGIFAEARLKVAYSDDVGFFFKPDFRISYTFSFLRYFTMAMNARWGFSLLESNKRLPFVDRFFLGGLNMRGYPNEGLGPRFVEDYRPGIATNEAAGGETLLNLSLELRFPVWHGLGLYGAIFVDAGALLPYQPLRYSAEAFARELFVDAMRYTAGLGLRWIIGDSLPPIVIDYGFLLNRKRGDPIGGFNFNVGYTF